MSVAIMGYHFQVMAQKLSKVTNSTTQPTGNTSAVKRGTRILWHSFTEHMARSRFHTAPIQARCDRRCLSKSKAAELVCSAACCVTRRLI
ncbi:MAG: hypothetical protein ABSD61_05865 [Terracidiphilus sp.]